MTQKQFYQLFDQLFKEERQLMQDKGTEYTISSDDKLENFKSVAKRNGLEPLQVCKIYLDKHLDSISNFVKRRRTFSGESIRGRVKDARNYLILLLALIEEDRAKRTQ